MQLTTAFKKMRENRRKLLSIFVASLTFLLILSMSLFSNAIKIDTQMSSSSLNIESKSDTKIEGTISVENSKEIVLPEIWCASELYLDEDGGAKSNLINVVYTPFSMEKFEVKKVHFIHNIPVALPKGNYSLIVRIYDRTNNILTFQYASLAEMGTQSNNKDFLSYDYSKCVYPKKTENSQASQGPTHMKGEAPLLNVPLKNLGTNETTFFAHCTVFKRSFLTNPTPLLDIVLPQEYKISSGEEKVLDITLPEFSIPESYLAEITFENKDKKQISGKLNARYVVAGEGGKIISQSANYNYGKFFFDICYIGSADASTVSDATLSVIAKDKSNGSIVLEENSNVTLTQNSKIKRFEKEMVLNCENILISAVLKKGDNIFDKTEFTYSAKEIEKQSSVGQSNSASLIDVKGTKYEEAVTELVKRGIIKGYPDNTYRSQENITRAEFMAILLNFAKNNFGVDSSTQENSGFPDVTTKHWAFKLINSGKKMGLLNGYPDGTFKPDGNVNYAEAITIWTKYHFKEDTKKFTNWPDDFITIARNNGMLKNISFDNSRKAANRGDIALLIYNIYRLEDKN